MPASNANTGFGCTFAMENATTPGTFDVLAEVQGVPGIGSTQRTSEVTHMTSPGGFAEHIGLGIKDHKPITLPLNFVADDAEQIKLFRQRVGDTDPHNYQIAFTDESDTTLTISAIVTETSIDHEPSSHAQGSVTFLPTGDITWA